jgi:hypothetical protein
MNKIYQETIFNNHNSNNHNSNLEIFDSSNEINKKFNIISFLEELIRA